MLDPKILDPRTSIATVLVRGMLAGILEPRRQRLVHGHVMRVSILRVSELQFRGSHAKTRQGRRHQPRLPRWEWRCWEHWGQRGHDGNDSGVAGFRKMKWFSLSFWSSLLTGNKSKSEELPPSETSTDVPSLPEKSSAPETKRGRPKGSTNKTKSKRTASQSSSRKKPNSGTKNDKRRRVRPPKKSTG